MNLRRLDTVIVASCGALVCRMVGHSMAHHACDHHSADVAAHSRMGTATSFLAPMAVLVVLAAVIQLVRSDAPWHLPSQRGIIIT